MIGVGQVGRVGGGGRRPLWTPERLGASLYDFWDAERSNTLTLSGAEVTAWASAKGGLSAAQATAANRPTWAANSFNGRPGVTFDGASDELTYAGVGALPTGATLGEIWALVDQNVAAADTATRTWFCYGGNGVLAYRRLYRAVASGVNRAGTQFGTGAGGPAATNGNVDYSGRHVHRGIIDPSVRTDVDGNVGAGVATTVPATGTTRVRFGATTDDVPSAYGKGVISFLAVTAPLSANEAARMLAYLKARGGIA